MNTHLVFITFFRDIFNSKITTEEADEDQRWRDLLVGILNFKKKTKPKSLEKKQKNMFLKTYIIFLKVEIL